MSGRIIIVGAPKCGTTSLFDWLSSHPAVCPSRSKEARFFIDEDYPLEKASPNLADDGLDAYHEVFSHCPQGAVLLEASPDYMYQLTALEHIPSLEPPPLVVFSLRRPSRRIYSLFVSAKHHARVFEPSRTFRMFIDELMDDRSRFGHGVLDEAVEHSRYIKYLERWSDRLPRARLVVLVMEQMVADPTAALRQIAAKAELDGTFLDGFEARASNETREAISERLDEKVRSRVALVGRLPAPVSRAARGIYRRFGTRPASDSITEEDREAMEELDRWFVEDNRRLAEAFGLDLSAWG